MGTMNLLGMGVTGALMALAVIVTRAALLNRLPKATFVVLWLLVAARLLVPFSIPVPWNAYTLVGLAAPEFAERVGSALSVAPAAEPGLAAGGTSADVSAGMDAVPSDTRALLENMTAAPESTTASLSGGAAVPDGTDAAPSGTTANPNAGALVSDSSGATPGGTTTSSSGGTAALGGTTASKDTTVKLDDDTAVSVGTAAALNETGGAMNAGAPAMNGDATNLNESAGALNSGAPAVNGMAGTLNDGAAASGGRSGAGDGFLWFVLPGEAFATAGSWLAQVTGMPATVAAIWAAGTLVCAGWFAASYVRSRRRFADSLPVEDAGLLTALREVASGLRRPMRLRYSERIDTPLTYGVLNPTILVPKGMVGPDEVTAERGCGTAEACSCGNAQADLLGAKPRPADLVPCPPGSAPCSESAGSGEKLAHVRLVLAHEVEHVRRFDLIKKLILAAALCLHWFNPLVWAMWLLANRDIELACDEAVVRRLGHDARSGYARMLIGMEETRGSLAPLYSAFNMGALEERIVAIMKVKKLSAAAVLASSLLVVGVPAALATTYAFGTDDGTVIISPRHSARDVENGGAALSSSLGDSSAESLSRHADGASSSDGADGRPSLAAPDEGPYANEAARAGRADEAAERLLTSYEAFGLSWGYGRNASYYDDSPWQLLMEYEGKDVCSVYDELHDVWIAASLGTTLRANGGIDLMATYDADGMLTGLVECDVAFADDASDGSGDAGASASRDRSATTSDKGRTGIFFASAADQSVAHFSSSADAAEWSSAGYSHDGLDSTASMVDRASSADAAAWSSTGYSRDGLDESMYGMDDSSSAATASSAISEGVGSMLPDAMTSEAAASMSDATFDAQKDGELSEADLRELRAWYAQFESYGLVYDETNGSLTYHDGDARIPVRQFVDEEGEGRLSMYTDYDVTDGINLRTVRDARGTLLGLEEFAGDYDINAA